MAIEQHAAGRFQQAEVVFRRLTQKSPNDANAAYWLGRTLFDTGRVAQSLYFLEKAAALNPKFVEPHGTLSLAMLSLGRSQEAERYALRVLELVPNSPSGLNNLGLIYTERGLITKADACFWRVVELAGSPEAALNHAVGNAALTRNLLGRGDEVVPTLRELVRKDPKSEFFARSLCAVSAYSSMTPREVFEAHRALGRLLPGKAAPAKRALRTQGGVRPMRVGFVSPDLRRHSVSYFLQPILQHRGAAHAADANMPKVEYYCYSATLGADDMSARLKAMSSGWREIVGMSDADTAAAVRGDQIDVLIDLAGHTSGNRMGVFLHGPAPATATYLGYASTTGMTCFSARLVDAVTDPEPDADALATERLARIPGCFVCYSPDAEAPAREKQHDSTTFASFNAASKLSPRVIDAWSKLLLRVPGSRLLLKSHTLSDPEARAQFVAAFVKRGVDASRVECVAFVPSFREHLSLYARVDVALDTFPYAGTTTTCEAMAMGVPVVTLAEPMGVSHHAGRVGASLLTAAGVPELIATSEAEYLEKAAALAADRARLRGYHERLPAQVRTSMLCDGPGFARRFEETVVRVFEGV
jgi:protein O-GlcNAc transferase